MNDLAGRLMDEMIEILGDDTVGTDCIDNVLHTTEELMSVLGRPELDQWALPTTSPLRQGHGNTGEGS